MTEGSTAWRYVLSTVRGTSHVTHDKPCQDWAYCNVHQDGANKPVLVALVSDGAGSAVRSDDGAQAVCQMFVNELGECFKDDGTLRQIDEQFMKNFFTYFRNAMLRLAEADDGNVADFACTFLVALIGENHAVFAQLGDGAIVFSPLGDCERRELAFEPLRGEYANMTHFVTESDAAQHLQYEFLPDRIGEVALFTDGIERLALNLQTMQPHPPFFRPMFAPVRQATADGMLSDLSLTLTNFLDSEAVNSRTDDDKTLILASRCLPDKDGKVTETAEGK